MAEDTINEPVDMVRLSLDDRIFVKCRRVAAYQIERPGVPVPNTALLPDSQSCLHAAHMRTPHRLRTKLSTGVTYTCLRIHAQQAARGTRSLRWLAPR